MNIMQWTVENQTENRLTRVSKLKRTPPWWPGNLEDNHLQKYNYTVDVQNYQEGNSHAKFSRFLACG